MKTQSQANPGSEGYGFVANGLYVQQSNASVEPFKEFGREEEDFKHASPFSVVRNMKHVSYLGISKTSKFIYECYKNG